MSYKYQAIHHGGKWAVENRQGQIVSVHETEAEADLEVINRGLCDNTVAESKRETRRILGIDYDPTD